MIVSYMLYVDCLLYEDRHIKAKNTIPSISRTNVAALKSYTHIV